uniref:Uncharacterized protein n=1 Tax=Arundo donax TaxID=35708 RepID=A0A0A9A5A3_ARUDO
MELAMRYPVPQITYNLMYFLSFFYFVIV